MMGWYVGRNGHGCFQLNTEQQLNVFFLAGALMIDEYLIIFMMDDFYVLAYYGVFIYG